MIHIPHTCSQVDVHVCVSVFVCVYVMVIPDEMEALDTAIEGVPDSFRFPPLLIFSGILSLLCTLHTLSAPSGYRNK